MRRTLATLLLCCGLGSTSIAHAGCKDAGSATAKPVFYYSADETVLDGVNASVLLGLTPKSFPVANVDKAASPACARGEFAAAGASWTLHGDDADEPPRWARVGADDSRIIFLALMPEAAEAHAFAHRKLQPGQTSVSFKTSMYALVVAAGDTRRVYGFYDAIPDDARLTVDMQAALDGRTPELLSLDEAAQKVDFTRLGAPYTLAFMASQGSFALTGHTAPDGDAFRTFGDDGVEAIRSHLRCPALPGYQRVELVTTGTDGGAIEVGCRYATERNRVAIFATSMPKIAFIDAFKIMVASGAVEDAGQPANGPVVTPPASLSPLSAVFNTTSGGMYAFWGFQRGDWAFEVFAYYGKGGEAPVAAAATALMTANAGLK